MRSNAGLLFVIFTILVSCNNEPNYHFTEIAGKQQHVLTWGKGEPAVIFLNGGGSTVQDFEIVQKAISKTNKTIAYDKFGLGKSELAESPRTLENLANELKELLEKEGITNSPIILVGHSMGGYVARYYLHLYPKNLVGIVLIDPGSEFLEDELRKLQNENEIKIADSTLEAQIKLIPKGFQMEVQAYPKHDSLLKTFSIKSNIPITLIESNKFDENDSYDKMIIEVQMRLYREFQKKMPQTKIISTSKSGHFVQLEEPHLVINAINAMLAEVKNSSRHSGFIPCANYLWDWSRRPYSFANSRSAR
jgi:pimeloyl-ACP methyl ester carboxylesterase